MQTQTHLANAAAQLHTKPTPIDDPEYTRFLHKMQEHFLVSLVQGEGRLFETNATNLFETYLDMLPPDVRQYHNCNCCRNFVNRFGGLVVIHDDGTATSAVWSEVCGTSENSRAIFALRQKVERARVVGVFVSPDEIWGTPHTGDWTHMALVQPRDAIFRHPVQTAFQYQAEKREEYGMVQRALARYTVPLVDAAVRVLLSEALYRNEKVLGPAQWLKDLHTRRGRVKGQSAVCNVTWLAVANAPAGFCHPSSSMVGTLLDDIADGLDFETVKAKFDAKMSPVRYQRPQAAPKAGNIEQAEALIERTGVARALARRFARIDEITALWRPSAPGAESAAGSVFGHLKVKAPGVKPLELPEQRITWARFRDTILPGVDSIQFQAPRHGSYTALLTQTDPEAPPILQWDEEHNRNPFSLYLYRDGSKATSWNVAPGWVDVTALTLRPEQWRLPMQHHGDGLILVLKGARDTVYKNHLCLFPETLKSEFHSIRSTIEAFSKSRALSGANEASACGYIFQKGSAAWDLHIRAVVGGDRWLYHIDRWE